MQVMSKTKPNSDSGPKRLQLHSVGDKGQRESDLVPPRQLHLLSGTTLSAAISPCFQKNKDRAASRTDVRGSGDQQVPSLVGQVPRRGAEEAMKDVSHATRPNMAAANIQATVHGILGTDPGGRGSETDKH